MEFKSLVFILCLFSVYGRAQMINEVSSSNFSNYNHPTEGYIDWIEIYNETGSSVDLEDFYLTDDYNVPNKWNFPDIDLNAGEYLVFMAKEFSLNDTTVNFSLSQNGANIYLFDDGGIFIDSINVPELKADDTYGRINSNYYFFRNGSPGDDNNSITGYNGYADEPNVSLSSGWYEETYITISKPAPDCQLWFSFNGLDPLLGTNYSGPIHIDENLSVKVVCTKDSLLPSNPIYRTYFIDAVHELPVVHLNIDSLEMFDDTLGIYVLGPNASPVYPHYGANYWMDKEIHAYYEYFDEEGALKEALDVGIKIHGGTVSTTRPMKSLRLVCHNNFAQTEFKHAYFKNKTLLPLKRMLLRNSGSDFNKTHIKDGIFHKFIIDHGLDVDAQAYQPVVVYINGEFWGIHNMREKLDKYYPATNYDVNPDSVNLLEEEELILISGDSSSFIDLRDFIINNDMSNDANYTFASQSLDMHSLVDYYVIQLFLNNRDWPYNNLKLWNSPEHPQWRYLFSDLDASAAYYGTSQEDLNSLEYILGPYGDGNIHVQLFKKLLDNNQFKRHFINRYCDLLNTIFQADYMLNYIYTAKDYISYDMNLQFYRWWTGFGEWDEHFLEYDDFFIDRVKIVQEELATVFNLDAAVNTYIGIYPGGMGSVDLNTIHLDSFPFSGKYYSSNLISLTAIEEEGTFKHWENLRTGEKIFDYSIEIDPAEGDSLIAIYDYLGEDFNLSMYPNPVLTESTLNFSIPESGEVSISLYSVNGQFISSTTYDYLAKGNHAKTFDFSHLNSSQYILTVISGNGKDAIKFVRF